MEQGGGASCGGANTGCSTHNDHHTTHDTLPAGAGAQSSAHTTVEASDDTHAGERARAGGGGAAAGASRGADKKRTRAAGSKQTGWGNEARSEINDATTTAVG